MSKVMRSVKNVTKGYSSVQVKVREGVCRTRLPSPPWPLGGDGREISSKVTC